MYVIIARMTKKQEKITKYNMKWNIINQRDASKSQKRRRKALLFSKAQCLAVFFAFLAVFDCRAEEPTAPSTAEEQWMASYTAMTEGNNHWSVDEFVEAVEAYRRAVAGFGRLRREFPAWRADVVAFRLEYCRTKLAECESQMGDRLEELSVEALARLVRLERERSARLLESLRTIQSEKSLADLRSGENKRLAEENAQLKLTVERLRRQLEALNGISEKYDKARLEMADLLLEFEDYKEKHGNKEK